MLGEQLEEVSSLEWLTTALTVLTLSFLAEKFLMKAGMPVDTLRCLTHAFNAT